MEPGNSLSVSAEFRLSSLETWTKEISNFKRKEFSLRGKSTVLANMSLDKMSLLGKQVSQHNSSLRMAF